MTTKEDCLAELPHIMRRTAQWRMKLAEQYPDDLRNLRAAEKLEELADDADEIPDVIWSELAPFCNPVGMRWQTAVSQINRDIRFRRTPKDWADYLRLLKASLTRH